MAQTKRTVTKASATRRHRRLRYQAAASQTQEAVDTPEARRTRVRAYLCSPAGQAALRDIQKSIAGIRASVVGLQSHAGAMQARLAGRPDMADQFEAEASKARDLARRLENA